MFILLHLYRCAKGIFIIQFSFVVEKHCIVNICIIFLISLPNPIDASLVNHFLSSLLFPLFFEPTFCVSPIELNVLYLQ